MYPLAVPICLTFRSTLPQALKARRPMTTSKATSLSPQILRDLREWWFEGVPRTRSTDVSVPDGALKKWFFSLKAIDDYSRIHFADALEASHALSIQQLTDLGNNQEDALSIILLLDQIPRNLYKNASEKKVYEETDPRALSLAKIFTSAPKNYDDRDLWTNWWQPSFFYLPLSHSEKLENHDLYNRKIAHHLDLSESEMERKGIQMSEKYEVNHRKTLERFGRYPSRNQALGRESTSEEVEFLKAGPGWLGSAK